MSIGAVIKRLRKEKGLTQEQLSEKLQVSPQAVSQWECDKSTPDIYQIPALVNIFETTADELFEINIEKNNAEIEEILEKAGELSKKGDWVNSTKMLREGLKKHPRSFKIIHALANDIVCYRSINGIKDYDEVFTLCNRILSECTDPGITSATLTLSALAYEYAKDRENMEKLVEKMPSASESKESFMLWKNHGKDGHRKNQEYFEFLLSEMLQILDIFEIDREIYSIEEQALICKQTLSLFDIFFPDKDYEYYAQFASLAANKLAQYCFEKGDLDNFFYWLERFCDYSVYYDTYDFSEKHTCPILRDRPFSSWRRENGLQSEAYYKIWTTDERFEKVRDDERFVRAVNRLKCVGR